MTDQKDTTQLNQREQCRKKFLRAYPGGFEDPNYISLERDPQWHAHEMFQVLLNKRTFEELLSEGDYKTFADNAIEIGTETDILYSTEKTALRSTLKSVKNAQVFATGLFNFMYSKLNVKDRFNQFSETLQSLPKKPRGFFSWPFQTAFAYLGNPEHFIFLKPKVTLAAAKAYAYDLFYEPRPNWNTYQSVYAFANQIKTDVDDLKPRDFIDLQSFMRVIGSGSGRK